MTALLRPLALALAVAILALAPAARAQQRLADVQVIGAVRIEPATVASYLTIRPGDPITDGAVNDSLRRLFETGLFADAAIDVQGPTLVVRVRENPTINRIAFEGNDALTDEDLLQNVSSRPRRAFTRSRAEADAQIVTEIYRQTGRFGTLVEPVIIELPDNRVDLVFEIQESGVTGVESINFVGNEAYSDYRLRQVIETIESGLLGFILTSDIYDPDRLEFDRELLRRFYLSRGYADFAVTSAVAELSPDREGFFITFTVSEGEIYQFGEQTVLVSAPGLDPAAFEALIEGSPGDTYDADLVDENVERMIFLAGQSGFAFVDVRPRAVRDAEARTIGVVYELVEGPRVYVERIDIEGNTRTLDRVIRRQFDIVEGDAFNSREVEKARRRIRGLGFFSDVDVETQRSDSEDRASIRVTVEEQPTGSLSFGVGFSSSDGPIGEVSISERNFLGRGQFVRARTQIAGEQQVVDFTFREPAFLDRDLSAGFQLYYRQDDRSDESSFEETNIGFVPELRFPLSENGRLGLTYRISNDEIRDVDADASAFIKADEGDAITSAIGYEYTYDARDDTVQPTRGFIALFGQDFAGAGGDTQYVRTVVSGKVYQPLFSEDVIASLALEGGNISTFGDDIRVTDRFYIGGDTFRGFERGGVGPRDRTTDDALGGNNYVVLRSEVTFPFGLPDDLGLSAGVFADVGTVWGLDTTSRFDSRQGRTVTIDDDPALRASAGVSLFWNSGFGPLRINIAAPIVKEDGDEEEYFRLTAGTRF